MSRPPRRLLRAFLIGSFAQVSLLVAAVAVNLLTQDWRNPIPYAVAVGAAFAAALLATIRFDKTATDRAETGKPENGKAETGNADSATSRSRPVGVLSDSARRTREAATSSTSTASRRRRQ